MCAQGTPPEAILMDYEMPVLNGPSATRLLRQQGCMVFIIGVTGNVMRTDIDYFKSCGVDAVFTKPLSKESVDKLVARIALPRYDRGSSSKWSVASSSVSSHLSTPSQMANALHSQLLLASQPHHPAPTAPPPTRPRTAGE
ncbi:hypothetical protein B484DRAFT_322755 [Ochromonadaceae sp. CCMP2298]|nr:hypothetical protein B484DRAFT_322755 [Ochromonadaceae sp. CCMP2298]